MAALLYAVAMIPGCVLSSLCPLVKLALSAQPQELCVPLLHLVSAGHVGMPSRLAWRGSPWLLSQEAWARLHDVHALGWTGSSGS